ncbi:hypothetical protein [Mesorhizobium sp.]|uniref:hypothetical protein n=1 Tax=Mesorhizobium sp. TaxID=1871066 RepID=UPI0025C5EF88|nr:hypothetical protein [Mesorhizobium sp.]
MLDKRRTSERIARQVLALKSRFGWRQRFLALLIGLIVSVLVTGRVAWADENFQAVQGIGVYFGVLPAAIVGGHPEWHVEGTMHGGAPSGAHRYHIVVAILDAKTGARIENARVTANVSGLAQVGAQNVALEPMQIAGTVTYGNFVELPGSDRYDIKLDITVPGHRSPVRVNFRYRHLQ